MDISITNFFGLKYILGLFAGFLLMLGSMIEPNIGIWVISLGGSLLTVALGKDQTLKQIFLYLIIGLFWGIFGSQILHAWWPIIPQNADAFFLSLFGVNATQYVTRNLESTTFVEIIGTIVSNLLPWKKNLTIMPEVKENRDLNSLDKTE